MSYGVIFFVEGRIYPVTNILGDLWWTSFKEVADNKATQFKKTFNFNTQVISLDELEE